MEEDKWVKAERLYNLAANHAKLEKPRRALFGRKCPKCESKLSKNTTKELLLGDSEFVNRVLKEASLPPGSYFLTIDHYTCNKCSYEFAEQITEEVAD
jgi:hypothetical protein